MFSKKVRLTLNTVDGKSRWFEVVTTSQRPVHRIVSWISFLVWFHTKTTETWTIRYTRPLGVIAQETVVRKAIVSFNIEEFK